MPSIIEEAFQQLYPEKELKYNFSLKYSRKFKPYNANVKLRNNNLMFNLSRNWKKISKEIQIGLIQELLGKILKNKKKTINIELYNLFMKNVHLAVPKTKTDAILEESFNRVNDAYFNGMLDKPNLEWGNNSINKLGSYEYGSDTITISTIFKNEKKELLDYVMHHEMLHKKFKFQSKNGRNVHHSSEFRRMEAKFENRDLAEKEISKLAGKHRFELRAVLNF
ncbi:SprT-like domain-containing protein [Candidatus Woesearchaeota archaeon]|nr:SprT-like domain-containing protein [Candidatus Woesearchaeota archaeon]